MTLQTLLQSLIIFSIDLLPVSLLIIGLTLLIILLSGGHERI